MPPWRGVLQTPTEPLLPMDAFLPLPAAVSWLFPRLIPTVLALCFLAVSPLGGAEATGTISGVVSNTATGNLLQGAQVEIPRLGVSALTDNTGRYVLGNVPAGAHELRVTYLGLDPQTTPAAVTGGARVTRDFALTSNVYQLDAFRVTGEREGAAAAITAQRNADNVKNVVTMDSFGNLPNMSAGELAIRLPGVAGNLDDEGNVTGLTIRGMGPALNRVNVDGVLLANSANLSRQFQTHSMTGAMFEQVEVIKGQTPDRPADSLGGSINLKTRSPLSQKEKRRVDYSFGARWAPRFTEQVPLRRAHPLHPQLNLAYTEVFSVLGGEKNLGLATNVFYSENVAGGFRTIRDQQNTANAPAYTYSYATQDYFNNRKQSSVNLKADYRFSPTTKFSANAIYNDAFEPYNRLYEVTATSPQTVATLDAAGNPAGTGAILPNYTDRITQVRAVTGTSVAINETMFSFLNRTRAIDVGGEHELDRWKIDYNASYSQAHINLGVGGGGTLTNTVAGVGWILDRTRSDLYPTFTPLGGPSIYDIANYRPGQLTARNNKRLSEVTNIRGNARYTLPVAVPASLSFGADYREQLAGTANNDRRWNYAGGTRPLVADASIVTWDSRKTGRALPMFETAALIRDYAPVDPTLWTEDVYFRESQKFINTRRVTEEVDGGYLMGRVRLGKFGVLAGARVERTEVRSNGWVRVQNASTPAQQALDPVGTAQRDYAGNERRTRDTYTDLFPSAHAHYDITPQLKARLSWSVGIGRPGFNELVPGETVNTGASTLTINNVGLKPQYAKNWDASLEYYFEPVGQIAVGWFHKDIRDYIIRNLGGGTIPAGANNGFNGDYANYTILTSGNAGSATVDGWEFSYQQQFTFLPGLLKTLSFSANYTALSTYGNFGSTTPIPKNQVSDFIPNTGNLNLSWRRKKFTARVRENYHGDYIRAINLTQPHRTTFRLRREVIDVSFSYQLRPSATLFCDVSNITNEPQVFYRGSRDRMERTIINGTTMTMGVSGRF